MVARACCHHAVREATGALRVVTVVRCVLEWDNGRLPINLIDPRALGEVLAAKAVSSVWLVPGGYLSVKIFKFAIDILTFGCFMNLI